MTNLLLNLRLFWTFFKSTLTINVVVSLTVALLAYFWTDNILAFPICFMTGGPLLAFADKEIIRPNEYYLYFNRGISKYQLITFTMAVCFILGISAFIIISYVSSS